MVRQNLEQLRYKEMTREERGLLLFRKKVKIENTPKGWRVPSDSHGGHYYYVKFNGHEPKCSCADCQMRRKKCKHIFAVEFYLKKEIDDKGKVTQTRGVKITYSQKWNAYDKSQTNEKLMFLKLLRDLCDNIEQPKYKFGRPTLPIADMIFGSALKVYSTFSLRRFMSDMQIAKHMKLIDKVPCYASIGHFFQKEELTPILKKLIAVSSTPLRAVEKDFGVDSSGFSTSRFARYFDYKWGKEGKQRIWIKAHLCSGVKTNIVAGVEITEGTQNDSPQLKPLVEKTAKNFEVREVVCDMAYSSRKNLQLISDVGAVPYIPFKKHTSGKSRGSMLWTKMYHLFMYKHDEFMSHYHKRSNSETVFHMIKTNFKDNLRSTSKTAQINELLLKILCHNIAVVIQEINELGVKGEFVVENEKRY